MLVASVALLATGVAGTLRPPRALPAPGVALLAALLALVTGLVTMRPALDALDALVEPILFLLLAVPLAAMLDDLGVFTAVASLARGRHLAPALWGLAAVTVAILNLDAAVVLLTPLYVRVARRAGVDELAYAAQPALLACLASSALPVSNLTNLIAVEETGMTTGAFLRLFGLPTLVAVAAGYAGWRFAFRHVPLRPVAAARVAPDRRALMIAMVVLLALVVGFGPGREVGIPPWAVVAVVDGALLLFAAVRFPVSAVPVDTALVAGSLAVLAAAVAAHVDVGGLLGPGAGAAGEARIVAVSALGANLANNLPVFLSRSPR